MTGARFVGRVGHLGLKIVFIVIREVIKDVVIFSNLIQTSKGRDKVFSLAQYSIQLYEKCMESSDDYKHLVKNDLIPSVRFAKQIRHNISTSRSVFKFLKWVDEYRAIRDLIKGFDLSSESATWEVAMFVLSVVHKTAGMFYYLAHNIVWIANMGAIYRHLIENTLGWRDIKDMFSLLSNVTETLKTFIKLA